MYKIQYLIQLYSFQLYLKKSVDELKSVGIEDINNNKQNEIHDYEKNERESEIIKVSTGNQF